MRFLAVTSCALAFGFLATSAHAQNWNQNQTSRIEQLERDMQRLQRSIHRDGAEFSPMAGGDAASIDVRFAQLDEQLRRMTGQIETLQHSIRSMEKSYQERIELLENKILDMQSQQMAVPATVPATDIADDDDAIDTDKPIVPRSNVKAPNTTASATKQTNPKQAQADYHAAFQLLNQAKFAEARKKLTEFTKHYPEDALIGNAYYWLGETYYVESDFTSAANQFRKGFEAAPEGNKAPDNLLKLGLSLSALDKKNEACIIYTQMKKRFTTLAGAVRQKLDQEILRLKCSE